MRATIIRRLEFSYPTTLDDFDRLPRHHRTHSAWRVSALAREFNFPWILPSALYCIFEKQSLEEIADARITNDPSFRMADEDRVALLRGTNVLAQEGDKILMRILSFVKYDFCCTVIRCHDGRTNTLRGYAFNSTWSSHGSGPKPLHDKSDHSLVFKWLSKAVCDVCVQESHRLLQQERRDFWSGLPGIFGLPDWRALEEMRKAAQL